MKSSLMLMRSSQVRMRSSPAKCGRDLAECGWDPAGWRWDLAKCGWDLAVCGFRSSQVRMRSSLAKCGRDLAECGWDVANCGWDLAESIYFFASGNEMLLNYTHKTPRLAYQSLKGLSHEIDFKNVDENGHILALLRAAAGFRIFWRLLWFLVEIKHHFPGKC